MNANELLKRAAYLMGDRAREYDKPEGERSMARAVEAFNIITGHTLKPSEGWLLLQVLKDVRQWQRVGYHADSAEDCIAYAALKAEALQADLPVTPRPSKRRRQYNPRRCRRGSPLVATVEHPLVPATVANPQKV